MTQVIQTDLSNLDISEEDRNIINGMQKVSEVFEQVASDVDEFELVPEHLAPDGLTPKTRSVSWLVEQIFVQAITNETEYYGLSSATYPEDDLLTYDLDIGLQEYEIGFSINTKAFNPEKSPNKDDVSTASNLANHYYNIDQSKHHLIVKTGANIKGDERLLEFDPTEIEVYNVQWVNSDEIYVNPANNNLQCKFSEPQQIRTKDEFIKQLLTAEQGIIQTVEDKSLDKKHLHESKIGFNYNQFLKEI